MFFRWIGLVPCLVLIGTLSAQTGVEPLRSSSDAGQRMFEQRVKGTPVPVDTTVYELSALEVAPVYPGGDEGLLKHLAKAPGCDLVGWNVDGQGRTKVVLRFVVGSNGTISQLATEGQADDALRRHVLCAAGTLQPFIPGTKGGRAVRALVRIPVQYEPR